jgi:hypothetical protein
VTGVQYPPTQSTIDGQFSLTAEPDDFGVAPDYDPDPDPNLSGPNLNPSPGEPPMHAANVLCLASLPAL